MSPKRSRSSSSSTSTSSSNHSSRSSSRSSRSSDSSHSTRSSKKSRRSRSVSSSASSASRSSRDSRDSRSVSSDRRHRSRSSPRRRGSKSPFNPKATKIYIGRLSRNVNNDHINEIFCNYGVIKSVELPADFTHSFLSRGFAYVEYEKPEDAEKAIKYMDGGQIDGQVINVSIAIGPRPKVPRAYKRKGRLGWKGGRSPLRHRRRSPRRRSPSPYRRPRRSISRSRSISLRKRRGSSRD